MTASNQGQQELWKQATDSGLMDPQYAHRTWLNTGDDRLCPICAPIPAMNPEGVEMDKPFRTPKGETMNPPQHPACRCTTALIFADENGKFPRDESLPRGWKWVDGKLVGPPRKARQRKPRIRPGRKPKVKPKLTPTPVEFIGDVSDEFRSEVNLAWDSIPQNVRAQMARNEVRIRAGKRVTLLRPDLKGLHPRGWPRGATWDWASGLSESSRREIVISEYTYRYKREAKSDHVGATLRHEIGHAVDDLLGVRSRDRAFVDAYNDAKSTLRTLPSFTGGDLSYYLQRGEAGKREVFAEGFARLYGPGVNRGSSFETVFGKIMDLIRQEVESL